MPRFKPVLITNAAVSKLPFAKTGQYLVRDKQLPGFFVVVGKRTKTYTVQYDTTTLGKRQTRRRGLGRFPELGAKDARRQAMIALGHQAGAEDALSLREGHAQYKRAAVAKKRSERTIQQLDDCVNRLLAGWLDVSLAELADNPSAVAEEHERITRDHGPYAANRAMAALRAIYNFAHKRDRSLPEVNPTVDVIFNPEHRRNTGMSLRQLTGWFKRLEALSNPVRRELHLFMLLSGLRPSDARSMQWEHVNIDENRCHIPHPKGGAAFDLPLSNGMTECLQRAREAGEIMHPESYEEWVFPADSKEGHVSEYKEPALKQWGASLRQSYATVAKSLGIDEFYLGLLLNHRSTSVTLGYVTSPALFEDALAQQQKISEAILTAAE